MTGQSAGRPCTLTTGVRTTVKPEAASAAAFARTASGGRERETLRRAPRGPSLHDSAFTGLS